MNPTIPRTLIIFGEALIDAFPSKDIVGGAPFNVARISACFDCAPLMITRIGTDDHGLLVRQEMQRFGLDTCGVQTDPHHATGRVKVHIENASHRFEIVENQAYDYIDLDSAVSAVELFQSHHADQPALFYFGTLSQRQLTSRATLDGMFKNSSAIKFLDLNLRDGQYTIKTIFASLVHADILKVNQDELQILIHQCKPEIGKLNASLAVQDQCDHLFEAVGQLLVICKLSAIIVTLGEQGYAYMDNQGNKLRGLPQQDNINVVDTVGCGDAFTSIFLVGLLHGWPLDITLQRAHAFAGAVCTIQGAISPDMNFYRNWQQKWTQAEPVAIWSARTDKTI